MLRRLLATLAVVILLIAVLAGGVLWLTLPPDDQTADIPGLSAPVTVGFDADGVPRIRAANEQDAAAALGFVHARDRMFQMDMMRRNASGRLSEIAGPATLRLDRMMRTLGLRRHAVQDLSTLPADTRALLEAYARGVNAWIAARGRFAAPEFLLLGVPEPWRPADSLLWAKTMGLWLSMNERQELARLPLTGRLPQQMIEELWPAGRNPATRTDAALPPAVRQAAAGVLRALPAFPAPFTLPASASNEWAVDGRHTATGAPLLAGDPHLAFGFPSIWYLARIDIPGHVLAGATAPGVPFLVIGHNERIAWTFTSTDADVQDVFIEPADAAFTVREERIGIRGQPDEVLTVRETRHGPVISDLDNKDGPVLAVAMGNLQPDDTAAAGLLALNRAISVAQAGESAAAIMSPVQNLLVADRQTIGLFTTGRIPVRAAGDGSAPVPGDGSHDWTGWLSGDQLPHIIAPASGRLINANEPVELPGFEQVMMSHDVFGDWRARRIRTLLQASERHTAAGFAAFQADVRSSFAEQVLPSLLALSGATGIAAQALDLLRGWDGRMTIDTPQPLIFNAWIARFFADVRASAGIGSAVGGPVPDFVAFVLSPDGTHWCGGPCGPMLRGALTSATDDLRQRFGNDPAAWRWGAAHQAIFAHPILRTVPLVGDLTTASIAAPGDDSTVDRGSSDSRFQAVHGASYRGVYDLSDLDQSLFVMTPGQSGHPLSPHARDFLARWRDGATIRLGPTTSSTTATIHLMPLPRTP
jgi:penicillin G amidase